MNSVSVRSKIHMELEAPKFADGALELAATIDLSGGTRKRLWYKVPEQYAEWITDSCDPFVIAIVFLASELNADISVRGTVSTSLLANLPKFLKQWVEWQPQRLHTVEVRANQVVESAESNGLDRAICAFSGGVDSTYTIYRHCLAGDELTDEQRLRTSIEAALIVHGFDIPLHQFDSYSRTVANTRRVLEPLGLEVVTLQTNFREVISDWSLGFGPAVISSLMLFSNRFNSGVVAADHNNLSPIPWGSNPITDPLLGSDSFSIVHDSFEQDRSTKIQRLTDWPEGFDALRVCWSHPTDSDKNCGRCIKCTTTWLYAICSGHAPPLSLPAPTSESVLAIKKIPPVYFDRLEKLKATDSWKRVPSEITQAIDRAMKFHGRQLIVENYFAPKDPNREPLLQNITRRAVSRLHRELGVYFV